LFQSHWQPALVPGIRIRDSAISHCSRDHRGFHVSNDQACDGRNLPQCSISSRAASITVAPLARGYLRGSPHRYFGSWRITGAHPAIELNSVNERSMLVRAIIRSFDTRQNRADDISFIPVSLGVRRPDHTCRFSGLSHQRVAYSYSRVGIVQLSQQELQLQVSNGRFNYMWTPACNLRLGASLVCA